MKKNSATAVEEVPPPIERPPEEAAAIAFREKFEAFHRGVGGRIVMSPEDRDALTSAGDAYELYHREARQAWSGGHSDVPEAVTVIATALDEYENTTLGEVKLELGDGSSILTPAIESATVRGVLVRRGDEILRMITRAIETGYQRLAKARERDRSLRGRVRFWMGHHPTIKKLIEVIVALFEEKGNDAWLIANHTLESLRLLQIFNTPKGDDAPVILACSAAGGAREWLSIAKEILDDEEKSV